MRICFNCGKQFTARKKDPDCRRCPACRRSRIDIAEEKFGAHVAVYPYCSSCGRRRTMANSHHHFKCDRCWKFRKSGGERA